MRRASGNDAEGGEDDPEAAAGGDSDAEPEAAEDIVEGEHEPGVSPDAAVWLDALMDMYECTSSIAL